MPLKVELTIQPTELAFQQDAVCSLKLTNQGKTTLTVLHPLACYTMPIWHVTSMATGQERVFQRPNSIFSPEEADPLPAGLSIGGEFKLLEKVAFAEPGEYEIVAEYRWDPGQLSARSAPVRVKITAASARDIAIVSACGGASVANIVAYVKPAAQAGGLVVASLNLRAIPDLRNVTQAGSIPSQARPRLAIPKNGVFATHQWVAWINDGLLEGMRLTQLAKDGNILKGPKLPPVKTELISPLLPMDELGSDGEAAAAVLFQTTDAGASNIQIGVIHPDGEVHAGPAAPIPAGTAVWGQGISLTSGERRIYAIARSVNAQHAATLTLHCWSWPVGASDVKKLADVEIEGDFAACRILAATNNKTRGVLLARANPGSNHPAFSIYTWQQGTAGEFELDGSVGVNLPPQKTVSEAKVAINTEGEACGAIHFGNGEWFGFTEANPELRIIPALTGIEGPVEIVMMGMNAQAPILVYGMPSKGLQFATLSGKTLEQLAAPIIGK